MDIRQFVTFKTIVETESFTLTAEKLHYAQSTISSHIQAIEEYMNAPVFYRIGKKLVLTETGKELYPKVLKLLKIYDEIKSIPEQNDELKGAIRIGTPESVMIYKLSPFLQEFKKKYPHVDITVESDCCSKLRERVHNGDLDIALLIDTKMENENLVFEYLSEEKLCIILPEGTKEIDSSKEQTVLYTEKGCSYRGIFENYLKDRSLISQNIIETASVELIKKYVLCGIGISLLPMYALEEEIKNHKIDIIKIENEKPCFVQMVYPKHRWRSNLVQLFIDLLKEKLKK